MSARGTLLAHSGAQVVSRRELATIDAPEPSGRLHQPIKHSDLVDALEASMSERGMRIARQQYAVQRGGLRFFGVLDVSWDDGAHLLDDSRGFAIGLRHANDQSMAWRMGIGTRIFICDNMALAGSEIAGYRKHTTAVNLGDEMNDALERWCAQQPTFARAIGRAQAASLTDDEARVHVCRVFERGVMPARMFPAVARNYFSADEAWTDCTPRNAWGLHNAFTRAARDMKPGPRYRATIDLGAYFQLN